MLPKKSIVRIPNPSSNLDNIIRVFIFLHDEYHDREEFSLEESVSVGVDKGLMASKGHIGQKARARSYNEDQARDSMINQFKMYAEVFRLLGWIRSVSSSHAKRTSYRITYLGSLVASAAEPKYILEQCLLAISFPNDANNTKFKNRVFPFLAILKTMMLLNGIGCRDEFIIGPLSLNDDQNQIEFNNMISEMREIRGKPTQKERLMDLEKSFADIVRAVGLGVDTVQNYTRIPIAALKWFKWASETKLDSLYGNKKSILSLTEYGREIINSFDKMYIVRCDEVMAFCSDVRKAVSLFGLISLLKRARYETEPLETLSKPYENLLNKLPNYKQGQEVWFSPYQQFSPEQLDIIFDGLINLSDGVDARNVKRDSQRKSQPLQKNVPYDRVLHETTVHVAKERSSGYSKSRLDQPTVINLLKDECSKNENIDAAVLNVFDKYSSVNKAVFYPAIGDLFNAIGFRCEVWPSGRTGLRWDAVIVHECYTIPIEIKSPSEERYIQVKGIRQALENKVVLDSREIEGYQTTKDTTTLIVGYCLPNNRAEVGELINDIKSVYEINIGIIDFKTLLHITALKLKSNLVPDFNEFRTLSGVLHVSRD